MIRVIIAALLALSIAISPSSRSADQGVYQNRGNRYEGIKPKPVAGSDIELLSARVDYEEPAQSLPQDLKVKFYLQARSEAFVTVRELANRYYYWLDKVQPAVPWGAGFGNSFDWPAKDVLQQLSPLRMYDLGILVRLDHPEPSAAEHVAPAIFYHSAYPPQVAGYLFVFRLNGTAHINAAVFPETQQQTPLYRQVLPRQAGGAPFTIKWDASKAPAGQYRLVIGGWFSDSNQPINQSVLFAHQPAVR